MHNAKLIRIPLDSRLVDVLTGAARVTNIPPDAYIKTVSVDLATDSVVFYVMHTSFPEAGGGKTLHLERAHIEPVEQPEAISREEIIRQCLDPIFWPKREDDSGKAASGSMPDVDGPSFKRHA